MSVKEKLLPRKGYVYLTSALPCEKVLVLQPDAFPVGTDVFSGQSTESSAPSLYYQVLSPSRVQRLVLDLAPALELAHL